MDDDRLVDKDVETPDSDALDVIIILSVEIGMCFVDETSDVFDTFTDDLGGDDTGVDVGVVVVVDIFATLVSFVIKTLVVCVVEVRLVVVVVVVVGSCILQRFAIAL